MSSLKTHLFHYFTLVSDDIHNFNFGVHFYEKTFLIKKTEQGTYVCTYILHCYRMIVRSIMLKKVDPVVESTIEIITYDYLG